MEKLLTILYGSLGAIYFLITPFVFYNLLSNQSNYDDFPFVIFSSWFQYASIQSFFHGLHGSVILIIAIVFMLPTLLWIFLIFAIPAGLLFGAFTFVRDSLIRLWFKLPIRIRRIHRNVSKNTKGLISISSIYLLLLYSLVIFLGIRFRLDFEPFAFFLIITFFVPYGGAIVMFRDKLPCFCPDKQESTWWEMKSYEFESKFVELLTNHGWNIEAPPPTIQYAERISIRKDELPYEGYNLVGRNPDGFNYFIRLIDLPINNYGYLTQSKAPCDAQPVRILAEVVFKEDKDIKGMAVCRGGFTKLAKEFALQSNIKLYCMDDILNLVETQKLSI